MIYSNEALRGEVDTARSIGTSSHDRNGIAEHKVNRSVDM